MNSLPFPPAISDRKPHFASIDVATGVTLHYLEQGYTEVDEQGDEQGEAILFLPGLSDSWHSYSLVLPLFSPAHHLFALDQRGHGNSSKAACCYTVDEFAADVVAFMDAKGIARATVAGHSFGSMVAQFVAIQYPERVARLVLIGSMTNGGTPGVLELDEAVQTFVDPIDPDFVRDFQMSTLNGGVAQEFLDKIVAESLKMPAHVWRQTLASFVKQETTPNLHKISAPTLIQWGDQDPFFPRSEQETLATLIPQAELRIYEQVTHNPHWEQPEQFVVDFEGFMAATKG